MPGDFETQLTLAYLREARELAEADEADAEYDEAFGDEDDDEEPFSGQYLADGYEPRRCVPVTLNAARPAACDARESRRLRFLSGLNVRV